MTLTQYSYNGTAWMLFGGEKKGGKIGKIEKVTCLEGVVENRELESGIY